MNYTTNYHLPQWVESDRIMMEDFNEAMEAIDTGLAAGTQSYQTVNTYSMDPGDTICTFPRAPRFVILFGSYGTACVGAGSTASMIDYYAYSAERTVRFRLTGNTLVLEERENATAASNLRVLAFF